MSKLSKLCYEVVDDIMDTFEIRLVKKFGLNFSQLQANYDNTVIKEVFFEPKICEKIWNIYWIASFESNPLNQNDMKKNLTSHNRNDNISDTFVYYYGTKNNTKQYNTFLAFLHHFLISYQVSIMANKNNINLKLDN